MPIRQLVQCLPPADAARQQALGVALIVAMLSVVTAAEAASSLRPYYQDNFVLETDDGAFKLRIRGNLHVDARFYQSENRGAPHSVDIRRGRIDLDGRIHDWVTFRLQPEFAGRPYLRNAWLDAELYPWLHVRLGQMKVPFSSSWLTRDNNVNFVERGSSTPVYPFFDRGALLWGDLLKGEVVYNVGVFTGAGIDVDATSGDLDDHKDVAARLFLTPFLSTGVEALRCLHVAAEGTWGRMSVPTSRFETGGLRSANYETAIWRWRTEQVLGTDGRVTDRLSAEIESRYRLGGELHYVLGPLALSAEYLYHRYEDITLYHDLYVGSSRRVHERLTETSGTIRSLSVWASLYLTGESKELTNWGWKTARPIRSVGEGGAGAWEILARYSRTWSDSSLFRQTPVDGFDASSPLLPADYAGATPGATNTVSASVLDGADHVNEATLGVSWTINPMVRIQLNDVFLWAPRHDRDGDGDNDNYLLSGAKSNQSDPTRRSAPTRWENAIMLRTILKI